MLETIDSLSRRFAIQEKHPVWGYVRVSGEGQEDNQSLGMQREAIERYCAEKKLAPPQFVEEVASAAKPIWVVNLPGTPAEEAANQSSPRPRFLLLLNHLKLVHEIMGSAHKSHLIVWRLDRLARVDYEQELFLTMFRKDNVTLHSVMPTENHMLDGGHVKDPARAFTRTVLAAAASYERAMIELRMTAGMTYKASQGGFTGGLPPFGYVTSKNELTIDPHEANIVRYIYHLRARYKMSNRNISRFLQTHKSPEDRASYDHTKIARILSANEQLYRGIYIDRYGSPHQRPDLRILSDDPEALLDYTPKTQPQRPESVGFSRTISEGSSKQRGNPGGDGRLGSPLSGEESFGLGLPPSAADSVSPIGS